MKEDELEWVKWWLDGLKSLGAIHDQEKIEWNEEAQAWDVWVKPTKPVEYIPIKFKGFSKEELDEIIAELTEDEKST